MDLIFIDADHTYAFATRDTENAMKMLAPGGTILWHDYRWDEDAPECEGVTRCVNEFHQTNQHCHEILGTRFAIYQDPRPRKDGENDFHECEAEDNDESSPALEKAVA